MNAPQTMTFDLWGELVPVPDCLRSPTLDNLLHITEHELEMPRLLPSNYLHELTEAVAKVRRAETVGDAIELAIAGRDLALAVCESIIGDIDLIEAIYLELGLEGFVDADGYEIYDPDVGRPHRHQIEENANEQKRRRLPQPLDGAVGEAGRRGSVA